MLAIAHHADRCQAATAANLPAHTTTKAAHPHCFVVDCIWALGHVGEQLTYWNIAAGAAAAAA
jgi:hypothetical protein